MTASGDVIRALYDDTHNILINVRAGFNGWSVSVIDTRRHCILRIVTFASRQRALDFAENQLRVAPFIR